MNYRQWKKAYKKEHGYNPPIAEDKRKQRKKAAKQLIKVVNSIPGFIESMKELVDAIRGCLEKGFEIVQKNFKKENFNKVTDKENE